MVHVALVCTEKKPSEPSRTSNTLQPFTLQGCIARNSSVIQARTVFAVLFLQFSCVRYYSDNCVKLAQSFSKYSFFYLDFKIIWVFRVLGNVILCVQELRTAQFSDERSADCFECPLINKSGFSSRYDQYFVREPCHSTQRRTNNRL